MKMDISSGFEAGMNYPKGIYIPQDDQFYLSSYRNGPKPADLTFAEVSLNYILLYNENFYTSLNDKVLLFNIIM